MRIARTAAADDTRALAGALATLVRGGDVVVLAGDLGAGKTAFTQGLGTGLEIDGPVVSPTFTLARQYDGRLRLHHLDVYRLEHLNEVLDVGLDELLEEGAVVVIEWGDAIAPVLPTDYLHVAIRFGEGDDDRWLELGPVGTSWNARVRALDDVLGPWLVGGAGC